MTKLNDDKEPEYADFCANGHLYDCNFDRHDGSECSKDCAEWLYALWTRSLFPPFIPPAGQTVGGDIDEILEAKPVENVPDDIWGTLHPTWTGLWTDAYGEWDERQASDLFPISDLLSEERLEWLKQAIATHTAKAVEAARVDEHNMVMKRWGKGPDYDLTKWSVSRLAGLKGNSKGAEND